MQQFVYKVTPRDEWEAAVSSGAFTGSPDDARDGFIHLSFEHQVDGVIERFFAGRADLLLVRLSAAGLGEGLRLEGSSDGEQFPHLYGHFSTSRAVDVTPIPA